MNKFDDITVVIPVREGSSRIKQKIFLPFVNGMNLLEWKIEQVKKVLPSKNIMVSSRSEKVKSIAHNAGVVYHERTDHTTVGHVASFSEVITEIASAVATEHFAWITVVVPLMRTEHYQEAFEKYLESVNNGNKSGLVSVNLLKDYLWKDGKPLNYKADKNHTVSQELPDIYRVNNGLYMRQVQNTLDDGYFLGKSPEFYEVDKFSSIDIDHYDDYLLAVAASKLDGVGVKG